MKKTIEKYLQASDEVSFKVNKAGAKIWYRAHAIIETGVIDTGKAYAWSCDHDIKINRFQAALILEKYGLTIEQFITAEKEFYATYYPETNNITEPNPDDYAINPDALEVAVNAEIQNANNVKINDLKWEIRYTEGSINDLDKNHIAHFPNDQSLQERRADLVNELDNLNSQLADLLPTEPNTNSEYKYYIQSRRPIAGAVPNGYISATQGEMKVHSLRSDGSISPVPRKVVFGVVVYDHPLSDQQIINYDLHVDPLNPKVEPDTTPEVDPIIQERETARNEYDQLNAVRNVIEKDCERFERLRDRCKSGSPKRKEYNQLLADLDPIIRAFGKKFIAAQDRYNKSLTLRTDEEIAATQKAIDEHNADLDARGIKYFATVYYYPNGVEGEDMETFCKDCTSLDEANAFVSQEDHDGVYVGGIYDAGWQITDRNHNLIADHTTGLKEENAMTNRDKFLKVAKVIKCEENINNAKCWYYNTLADIDTEHWKRISKARANEILFCYGLTAESFLAEQKLIDEETRKLYSEKFALKKIVHPRTIKDQADFYADKIKRESKPLDNENVFDLLPDLDNLNDFSETDPYLMDDDAEIQAGLKEENFMTNREKLLALRKEYIITDRLSANNSSIWYVNGKRSSQVKVWNLLQSYGLTIAEFLAEDEAYINECIAASCKKIAIKKQADFLYDKIKRDAQPSGDNVFDLLPDLDNDVEKVWLTKGELDDLTAKFRAAVSIIPVTTRIEKMLPVTITITKQNSAKPFDMGFGAFAKYSIVQWITGLRIMRNFSTLGRYDTPAQVEKVIDLLKMAITRGDKAFTFPTVEELDPNPDDELIDPPAEIYDICNQALKEVA